MTKFVIRSQATTEHVNFMLWKTQARKNKKKRPVDNSKRNFDLLIYPQIFY